MKTKIFLVGYFAPSWIASLFRWGDERTSVEFAAAPSWFFPLQLLVQALAIAVLFTPPKVRERPSLGGLFFAIVMLTALYFAQPIIEAEYLLITGSILIAAVSVFLCVFAPSVNVTDTDVGFLYYLFMGGFAFQGILYLQFGIVPSHSIEDVFIRFNGITNDSLSTAFIMPFLTPWAVNTRYAAWKLLFLNGAAFMTGSMFAIVMVPTLTVLLLARQKKFHTLLVVGFFLTVGAVYFYEEITRIFSLKLLSIISHLSFFLSLSGRNVYKSVSCSEEFCESFVQSGLHLSAVYVVSFYCLFVFFFLLPLLRSRQLDGSGSQAALLGAKVYGVAILVGSMVHPVPILPIVIPLFMLLTSAFIARPKEAGVARFPNPRPAVRPLRMRNQ